MPETLVEVALNGPWGRDRQPGIPVRVDDIVAEGIACAKAGAAVIHAHAYDAATGRQRDDWEIYARIIEGIRAQADCVVYPTIPLAGSGYADAARAGAARYGHLAELARRGLVEWAVVDPGSVNFSRFDTIPGESAGFVYLNPEEHVRAGLSICAEHGVRPSYAIYEPGFTRLGAALARRWPSLKTPVYRFMFSDEFAWGFPPRPAHLDAHLALLAEAAPGAPWMVAGLGVDISPLIAAAVARGGHVRVGLEDAPWGTPLTNLQWTQSAVARIIALGSQPMSATGLRQTLG
jgi:3-keto-5-aminohexanoate cleavage enzyme